MAFYVTVQKTQLISYLSKHVGEALTAREIYLGMKNDPDFSTLLAKSTLYRLLEHLAQENIIIKDVKKGSRQFIFRYMGEQNDCAGHLHMTCLDCGELIHLGDEQTKEIQSTLGQSDCDLDEKNTMLFGHCDKCKGKK